jgi:WNK lysine deficient protein kinase
MTDDSPLSPDYETPAKDPLAGVVEISPNKRYIRFGETLSRTTHSNIQSSYKAFDTKNGIEVAWHIINLNSLNESEQSRVIHSVHTAKDIQNKYITEFLSHWFDKTTHSLNIITSDLSTLKEFIDTVLITLRWRIVKKWCKQILIGLNAIHSSSPPIVHGNISCGHIFIDSGLGETKIGDLWLAHVLDAENSLSMNALVPYAVAFTAPEILSKQSFNTKVSRRKCDDPAI